MKKALLILATVSFLVGCNINPSKETRIQKLESNIQIIASKVNDLELKVQALEAANGQLKMRVYELEKTLTN